MKTIKSQWESYRDQVLPKDASPTQISECRLVFWAASVSMFNMVMDAVGAKSDRECSKALAAIDLELQVYRASINTAADTLEAARTVKH